MESRDSNVGEKICFSRMSEREELVEATRKKVEQSAGYSFAFNVFIGFLYCFGIDLCITFSENNIGLAIKMYHMLV